MNLITNFLTIQNQIKVFHWQTNTYGSHKAYDKIYEAFTDLIDEFIEIYQGKYGIIKSDSVFEITLSNLEGDPNKVIDSYITWLKFTLPKHLDETDDSDLLNIRDEMMGSLNTLKYLLTLR